MHTVVKSESLANGLRLMGRIGAEGVTYMLRSRTSDRSMEAFVVRCIRAVELIALDSIQRAVSGVVA